ncbi:hypothetical protein FBY22_3005 [Streptomyces sp. SLBN-31]|nr:hypothetical protein FBY22_3005 [Streptomyces sp. SLBN-31]
MIEVERSVTLDHPLAEPLLKREFQRLADEVSEQLPRAVDRAVGAPETEGRHPR